MSTVSSRRVYARLCTPPSHHQSQLHHTRCCCAQPHTRTRTRLVLSEIYIFLMVSSCFCVAVLATRGDGDTRSRRMCWQFAAHALHSDSGCGFSRFVASIELKQTICRNGIIMVVLIISLVIMVLTGDNFCFHRFRIPPSPISTKLVMKSVNV